MTSTAIPGPRERWVLIAAVTFGIVLRCSAGWQTSLWIDETYTGVIAGQPTAGALIGWLHHELSGPVYYSLAWIFAQLFGVSNAVLRAPSYILAVASVVMIAWQGHPQLRLRLLWAALFALWWPGILYAGQARPQSLLAFLAVVQAVAFLRLWESRTRLAALAWTCTTALMLLTHLYAAVPSGLQGLALVWALRGQWQRLWPTLVGFVPVVAWYSVQLPYYLGFAKPGRRLYPPLGPEDSLLFPAHLLGGTPIIATLVLGLAGAVAVLALSQSRSHRGWISAVPAEAWLASAGTAAAVLIFITGMFRDSYIDRYLIPCAPASLLGIAMAICHAPQNWERATRAILPMLLLQAAILAVASLPARAQHNSFPAEFEQASAWLMGFPGKRPVVFVWDSPAIELNADHDLAEIGGFFFARAGAPRRIVVGRVPSGEAGSRPILARARSNGADVIWLGDGRLPRTLMRAGDLECRLFHRRRFTQVVACHKKMPVAAGVTIN